MSFDILILFCYYEFIQPAFGDGLPNVHSVSVIDWPRVPFLQTTPTLISPLNFSIAEADINRDKLIVS